jgi:hypothetical protein
MKLEFLGVSIGRKGYDKNNGGFGLLKGLNLFNIMNLAMRQM